MDQHDSTQPPLDFSAVHRRLEELWGYPPRVVPYRSPFAQSRPTHLSPRGARAEEELPSMERLRLFQQEQKKEKAQGHA